MLLLLLMGGGQQPGERAYASVSFTTEQGAETALSLVNPTEDSLTLTTDALPTEE